ncbi:MAG: hypothetical protein ACKPKO_14080, partial [Candidatus Fonsibacter sp.]
MAQIGQYTSLAAVTLLLCLVVGCILRSARGTLLPRYPLTKISSRALMFDDGAFLVAESEGRPLCF